MLTKMCLGTFSLLSFCVLALPHHALMQGNSLDDNWCTGNLCDEGYTCYPAKYKCDGQEDCDDGTDEINCPKSRVTEETPSSDKKCGIPSLKYKPAVETDGDEIISSKHGIVGGDEATPHSFPWQAWLFFEDRDDPNSGEACGGALISPEWIVTAAHCIMEGGNAKSRFKNDLDKLSIFMGMHEKWSGEEIKAAKAIVHPKYKKNEGNDIAVVKLEKPVEYDDIVQPICLPTSHDNYRVDGKKVVVTGWGTLWEKGESSDTLQQVILDLDITKCAKKYASIDQNEMCAYTQGKDSCQGDSGGPLVLLKNGQWTLGGVVSWGRGCARKNTPGVYAHVPYFREWIRKKTGV